MLRSEHRVERSKAARRRQCGDIVEERQRSKCPRSAGILWLQGDCGAISLLLVVNDVPASPPPRAWGGKGLQMRLFERNRSGI